jgi:cytoskeletal protein RodZ
MKSSSYSPHYEKLRAWLKQKREDKALSLRNVSQILGRHHSIVGKMEQNRRKIEVLEFLQYCDVLGADPHEGLQIMIESLKNDEQLKQ